MGWKIFEIENAHHLNLFLNNIVIKFDNNELKVPINDLDVLLINNYKLKITINLINELTRNNILVIVCDDSYLPQSIIVPIIGNFNTLKVIEKQIKWSTEYKANIWMEIIKQKIQMQANFLKILNNIESYNLLNILISEMRLYDVSNREGHAAKIYWHNLFGINFKRHNDDYINTLLNYGYTILRGYFTRSIIKKGLDPRISIFHKSFHNYFALASDLMEPFRIFIDCIVYKLTMLKEKNFYFHKQEIIKSFNQKIMINKKYQYINNAIDIYVDAIVNQDLELPEIEFNYEWL